MYLCQTLRLSSYTLSIAIALAASSANACTTFASVGSANQNGGLLMAKNRDSTLGFEQLAIRRQEGSNTYLGLFFNISDQHPYPLISAGINEHGLSVVQNESVSITSAERQQDAPHGSAVIYSLLEGYNSVDEVLANQQELFGNGLANFLIIGDKTEAILVEVGPEENAYQILRARDNNNRVYHTNHYVLKSMQGFNKTFYPDSENRFKTIKYLMNTAPAQLTADGSYYQWTNSAQNGPYNSIFRNITLASWITSIPESGIPEIHVRLTSPSRKFEHYQVQLTPEFWSYPPAKIQPLPVSFAGLEGEPIGSERRYTYTEGEHL